MLPRLIRAIHNYVYENKRMADQHYTGPYNRDRVNDAWRELQAEMDRLEVYIPHELKGYN